MKIRAFTLVELMITVAIIALLAAISVPGVLRARVNSADSKAKTVLRATATALENYRSSEGIFPNSIDDLVNANPAYIEKNYFDGSAYSGYTYTVTTLNSDAYQLDSAPVNCGVTGTKNYEVVAVVDFQESDC